MVEYAEFHAGFRIRGDAIRYGGLDTSRHDAERFTRLKEILPSNPEFSLLIGSLGGCMLLVGRAAHAAATQSVVKIIMKILKEEKGKISWILLWAMGAPIPVLIILFLLRGCT
jgi:hypothetical protein